MPASAPRFAPGAGPQYGGDRCGRRRLPQLLHLRHPLLRLRRGDALAQPRHRTIAELEATGMELRLDTQRAAHRRSDHKLLVTGGGGEEELIAYDALVVGTGAVSVRPSMDGVVGDEALGAEDGVHLLHSMGDTFAVMRTLEERSPASAVIVGAGYIGLEMAEALVARGISVIQLEQLPEVLPTVTPRARDPRARRARRARCGRAHRHDGEARSAGPPKVQAADCR